MEVAQISYAQICPNLNLLSLRKTYESYLNKRRLHHSLLMVFQIASPLQKSYLKTSYFARVHQDYSYFLQRFLKIFFLLLSIIFLSKSFAHLKMPLSISLPDQLNFCSTCHGFEQYLRHQYQTNVWGQISTLKVNWCDKIDYRLTLLRMGFFGASHGWGEAKRTNTSQKPAIHILQ